MSHPDALPNTSQRIRLAILSDLTQITKFDHIASRHEDRVALIRRGIDAGKCWLAEDESRPIGYGLLKEGFYGFDFIELLYVAETARRRGIGRALLKRLEQECKTPKVFTSTNESNGAMQRLLERLGYRPSGVIHNLDVNDPELVFVKDLTAPRSN